MKKYRLIIFYFIALLLTVVYGNIAYDAGDLASGFMAAIPFGIVLGFAAWFLGKNESLY